MITIEILKAAIAKKETQFFDVGMDKWIDFEINMPLNFEQLNAEWRRKPISKTLEGFIFPSDVDEGKTLFIHKEKLHDWMLPATVTFEVPVND